jgi:drug/metabolite transporter (DMT)-like permease
LSIYTYYYAVQKLLLVNAVTLSNTSPLFIPFFTLIWLKLLVSKRRFLATAIGFVGVLVLLRPTGEIFEWASVVGLSSGFFGAIALISVRQLSKTENTETILSYYFLLGVVIAFLPLPFTWQPIAEPIQWLYIFLSSICAFIYQFAITKAYTHAPATKVSTLNYLSVVFSGLLGWWIFAEIPDYWVLIGTLLIICGALIALFDQTPAKRIGKSE